MNDDYHWDDRYAPREKHQEHNARLRDSEQASDMEPGTISCGSVSRTDERETQYNGGISRAGVIEGVLVRFAWFCSLLISVSLPHRNVANKNKKVECVAQSVSGM